MRECIYAICRDTGSCLYPDRAKDLACPSHYDMTRFAESARLETERQKASARPERDAGAEAGYGVEIERVKP